MLVAWTSRSDIWNDNGASHVSRHVLRQAPRTAVKDNQGRRQHALPRRHGHDRTTSWPDSPRGSLTAPLAASGVLPIWPLPLWAFGISRCQSACSSPTAHGSSCTCVAESITHATYNRLESVPGPHSVRQSVYEKNGLKWEVATCTLFQIQFSTFCHEGTAGFCRFCHSMSQALKHHHRRLAQPARPAPVQPPRHHTNGGWRVRLRSLYLLVCLHPCGLAALGRRRVRGMRRQQGAVCAA